MMIWIVAVILLLLIWGGGFALRAVFGAATVSIGFMLLLSLIPILLVVGVLLYRRWRAHAAARALERELLKQSEQQAANARPDRRAEIIELQRQMQEGIAALKKSKLGARQGAGALYALPWYAIIGPPGAGKTTALRHSGLSFPFLDPSKGGAVRGSGGTRNCDWWFTNEAILLDTAGRYATEEDDREEWLAFLTALKKYRKTAPINGIIVAVAVPELIQEDEQQAVDTAKRLRARIDEVMTRLDVVLPVYLMFTKADLISGFVEFWGDLRKSERDQVLGATVMLEGKAVDDPAGAFTDEFDEIASTLQARAVRTIHSVRQLETRQRVLQYPLEFRALRDQFATFVGQLFQRNAFQENPVFRGFYFTSGTQEGVPIDRVIGGMARAFGLNMPATTTPTEPKSYFVTDVFKRVMFPDQHLVEQTAGARLRSALIRLAFVSGAVLLSVLLLGPGGCSFSNNSGLIAESKQVAETAKTVEWRATRPTVDDVQLLDDAADQIRLLYKWREQGAPVKYRWGMYTGNELYPAVRDAWVAEMDQGFKKPTLVELQKRLLELGRMADPPTDDFGVHYTRLKLYIMMHEVKYLEPEWAVPRLMSVWRRGVNTTSGPENDAMLPHVQLYVDLLKRGEIPKWEIDSGMLERGRIVLKRAPRLRRIYQQLISDANTTVAPIRRKDIFYGSVAPLVTSKEDLQVDGAYTKEGWGIVRKVLESRRTSRLDERWVLDVDEVGGNVDKQIADLRQLYFDSYKKAWRDFLLDMEIRQPEDATESLNELTILCEPEEPYKRLLRILTDNIKLDMPDPEEEAKQKSGGLDLSDVNTLADAKAKAKREAKNLLKEKAAGEGGGEEEQKKERIKSPVEEAYEPLIKFAEGEGDKPSDLGSYQGQLESLVGVLSDLKEGQIGPDTSDVAKEFQTAFRATNELLTHQSGYTRAMLAPYLLRPLTGAWTGVINDAGGAANGLWSTNVWEAWHAKLANKYPFVNSPDDVKLEDFTEFFKPDSGLLWSFYDTNLKPSLDRNGDTFTPTRRFRTSMAYAGPFLSVCLKRGAEITRGTFPEGSETPVVAFDVNLHSVSEDVSEVIIEIDGVSQTYRNTPEEWISTQWPAEDAKERGAKVRIRGRSGLDETITRPGEFGFFRLLDAAAEIKEGKAGGRPNGVPTKVATWYLRSERTFIKLDIRPNSSDAATHSDMFMNYTCPRVIVHSSGG